MQSEEFIAYCKTYKERESERTPIEALTLLTDAYIAECGVSMTYRTLVEGASWYWQKLLAESEHVLANFAKKHSFTQLMPYLSEEFNQRKEHYWEYDICNLDSDTVIEAAQCYMKDIEGDERLKAVFAIGIAHYIEWLKNFERDWNKIIYESKDSIDEKTPNKFTEEDLRKRLHINESEIKSIAGNNPDEIVLCKYLPEHKAKKNKQKPISQRKFERLGELLLERCTILNALFQATDSEMTHFRQVNEHLLSLRNKLYQRTTAMKHTIVSDPDFDDDYEIEGLLTFRYNDESTVLQLDNDEFYGSDFKCMCSILESYYESTGNYNIAFPIGPDEFNSFDDGESWSGPPFDSDEFKDIIIGYALHDLCNHKNFSIPDVVRLNDFWAEVVVKVQSLTTQSGERSKFI